MRTLLFIFGLVATAIGCWMHYPPMALIVVGCASMGLAALLLFRGARNEGNELDA